MPTVTLTKADNGKSVGVGLEDEIVLRLPENATTGYRWHVQEAVERAGRGAGSLRQEADAYSPDVDSSDEHALGSNAQFGRGGVRELRFRPQTLGAARLELKHWQAWEGETSVTERFVVTIEIAG